MVGRVSPAPEPKTTTQMFFRVKKERAETPLRHVLTTLSPVAANYLHSCVQQLCLQYFVDFWVSR